MVELQFKKVQNSLNNGNKVGATLALDETNSEAWPLQENKEDKRERMRSEKLECSLYILLSIEYWLEPRQLESNSP